MARPSFVSPSRLEDPREIAEACRNPARARVLIALGERPGVTIEEIAVRLGESPGRVQAQVDGLLAAGLAEVTAEEGAAGATRRRYGSGSIEAFDESPAGVEARTELGKAIMRVLMSDLATAAAAGTQSRRPEDFEVRTYGEVDDGCCRELLDLHQKGFHEICRSIEEGIARTKESGERGTEVVSALFFFEVPLWGAQAPRRSAGFPVDRSVDPDPQALAKVAANPLRWRVLVALSERPELTIRELAAHLGEPQRRVRHQIETLVDLGLAVVTSEQVSRVIERRYGAGAVAMDYFDGWTRERRLALANAVIRTVVADLSVAATAGTFAVGGRDIEGRMYGEVDDACLAELRELHWSIYRGTRTKLEEGYERVMESGEAGTEVVSALFAFEVPLWHRTPASPRRQETA